MNPRSLLAHHLPTLTEVVEESSIPNRGETWPSLAISATPAAPPLAAPHPPVVDLSDTERPVAYRTPTPQEVERLRGDDAPFEATISDHEIRRALAEADARAAAGAASAPRRGPADPVDPVDLSFVDEADPVVFAMPEPVIDEAELQTRVLAGVQRQVDALLEHRLREALAPLLAQVTDAVAAQAREILASSLRDVVSQAVAHEIERQRGR